MNPNAEQASPQKQNRTARLVTRRRFCAEMSSLARPVRPVRSTPIFACPSPLGGPTPTRPSTPSRTIRIRNPGRPPPEFPLPSPHLFETTFSAPPPDGKRGLLPPDLSLPCSLDRDGTELPLLPKRSGVSDPAPPRDLIGPAVPAIGAMLRGSSCCRCWSRWAGTLGSARLMLLQAVSRG